jgi:peptidyl-prolyl cis-trans isomerase SurA
MKQSLFFLISAAVVGAAVPVAAQTVAPPTVSQSATRVPVDAVVGIIGEQPIMLSDVDERLIQEEQSGRVLPKDSTAARAVALRDLVDEQLIAQKAAELKITVPDAEILPAVDAQIKQVRARFPTETEYRNALAQEGMGTPEEYRKYLTDSYRTQALSQRTMDQLRQDNKFLPVPVSDSEVAAAFAHDSATMPKRGPTVTFRQIIVAPQPSPQESEVARVKAESLLAEIHRGADFATLAKRESMDETSKQIGGDMGWSRRGDNVPELDQWLFVLPPDQVSPVIGSPLGYHLIKIERAQPGEVKWRQILITPRIDSADIAAAHRRADSVVALWKSGTPFDTLSHRYHDFAHHEETALLVPFVRDSLPDTYQQALAGKKAGDIVSFPIPWTGNIPKFAVVRLQTVDETGTRTLAEMRQYERNTLEQAGGVRRYLDGLRKSIYVWVSPEFRIGETAANAP